MESDSMRPRRPLSAGRCRAGAKTVAQIEENAAAADVAPLTAAELRRALPLVDGLTVPNWAGN